MFGVILMLVLGVSSVMPVLPRLMGDMDVSARSIGLVLALFTLPGIFLAPVAGVMADRIGRKRILVLSLTAFGLCGTGCAFVTDFETLLFFRFLQGVGVAPMGVLYSTIVGDLYDGRERTAALGYSMMVLGGGTAVFPIVGGILGTISWRYPFALPIIAVPVAFLVHRFLQNPEPEQGRQFKEYVRDAFLVARTRRAAGLFLITFLTAIVLFGPVTTFLPVLLRDRFDVSPAAIGLVISVASLFTALASSQLGRLSGAPGVEVKVLSAAFILYLACMALIPLLSRLWMFVLPIALFGAAMGINGPIRISLLAGLAPMSSRAAIMSLNNMILRLGQTIAPVLMGLVAAWLGIDAVYWAGAGVAVIMLVVVGRMVK